jgi:hypothetical protein
MPAFWLEDTRLAAEGGDRRHRKGENTGAPVTFSPRASQPGIFPETT